MRSPTNHIRYLAAGVIFLAGAAWAGTLYRAPEASTSGTDPQGLRILAERVRTAELEVDPLLDGAPSTGAPRKPTVVVPKRAVVPAAPRRPAPELPPVAADGPVTPVKETPAAAPKPEPANPVKSIALMGVTNRGDVETAWLVNVDNQERELAEVGDRAFGLTIKDIDTETVLLSDGEEEYLLRMGDKQIPVTQVASVPTDNGAGGMGGGEGRRGRWGQNGGDSGASGFSRRRGGFGGGGWGGGNTWSGGSGNRGSFGGGSFGGGSFGGGSSSGSSSFAGRGSNSFGSSGISGRSSGGRSGGFSGGGFSGGGFSGGGFSGGSGRNSMSTSQFAAGSSGPTSNPQTARRRGGQLTGDTPAQPQPATISNPQTQRRTGSASGSAFGMQQQGGRSSGFGGSGFGGTRQR